MKASFRFERETKGAVRYLEVDSRGNKAEPATVGTLYIRKEAIHWDDHLSNYHTEERDDQ